MTRNKDVDGQVSFLGATAIGIGGMVGGGIFAVLGLATVLAGGATPLAFLVGGGVALLTAYSYARLSVAYPSGGGTIIYIDKAFQVNWCTGSINNLLWLGYILTLALYAVAFGNYAATFLPSHLRTPIAGKLLAMAGIVVPTLINLFSATIVSRAETLVVVIKLAILLLVVAFGFGSIDPSRLQPATWKPLVQIASAGMIIFVAYEGFELIANTAANVRNYRVTLPRAYYTAVLFVILLYVLIAVVVVGSLSPDRIVAAQDFALAEAATPTLGRPGFVLVGLAAVLATLSAINSTLYGAARLSYSIATEGELPRALEHKAWNQPVGLLITSGAALLLASLADLTSIATMASASFLIIFALVNLANFRLAREIGSSRVVAMTGAVACGLALLALLWRQRPSELVALLGLLVLAVAIEGAYVLYLRKEGHSGRIHRPKVSAAPSGPST